MLVDTLQRWALGCSRQVPVPADAAASDVRALSRARAK